jgi:hypothetical protein
MFICSLGILSLGKRLGRFPNYLGTLAANSRRNDHKLMKPHSITVRLGPDLKQRLHQSARKLDLSENGIAKHAVRAAVDFIEANNYTIELPFQMATASGPIEPRVRRPKKVTGPNEPERRYPKRKNRIPPF